MSGVIWFEDGEGGPAERGWQQGPRIGGPALSKGFLDRFSSSISLSPENSTGILTLHEGLTMQ